MYKCNEEARFHVHKHNSKSKDSLKVFCLDTATIRERDIFYVLSNSGSIVSDYGLDDRAIEVRFPTGAEDFSSSPCVWGPPSLLSNGYREFFPQG
jgi:hypothetical protein